MVSGFEAYVGILSPGRPFPDGTGLWLSTWSWLGVAEGRAERLTGPRSEMARGSKGSGGGGICA